jgi:hypothetical protein
MKLGNSKGCTYSWNNEKKLSNPQNRGFSEKRRDSCEVVLFANSQKKLFTEGFGFC